MHAGLSVVVASRGYSLVVVCMGFSLRWLLLGSAGSIVVAHGLSCSWIFLTQGSNSHFHLLSGGFFTTEPPGKPLLVLFILSFYNKVSDYKSKIKSNYTVQYYLKESDLTNFRTYYLTKNRHTKCPSSTPGYFKLISAFSSTLLVVYVYTYTTQKLTKIFYFYFFLFLLCFEV